MHVRTRKLAFAGLMLAVTIVCLYLGNIIESNTLFLLAGASYFVGIVGGGTHPWRFCDTE